MRKEIENQLKQFYRMKIPQYLYENDLISIIVLHEEFAGLASQLLHHKKLTCFPSKYIDDDERIQINELLKINEICNYVNTLLKIETIFKQFEN